MLSHSQPRLRVAATIAAVLAATLVQAADASAAVDAALTRYPYLTDAVQTSVTLNWATTRSGTTGTVQWGPAGSCAANTTAATRTNLTVVSTLEYQWKAVLPVNPDTRYCYRVFLGAVDLLGTDLTPTFTSQVAKGSSTPFSFAVFGDWGQAYANSTNADQQNVLSQISQSDARFAVMTGDAAYPSGDQRNYGDLLNVGTDISGVFAPPFWGVPGHTVPVFNVTGNHGFTNGAIQVFNWPEENAASSSGGRYLMENYPAINGSTAHAYPSVWYAFDAGKARFYILTTAWADGNVGTGSVYANDAAAHWTPSSAEYQWLANDIATHPSSLKFAFWHYPLYADSSGQPSDTFLHGGNGTLQGLLDQNNVNIVFNGHAHGYERNLPDPAGLHSYVVGNGGAALGAVSGCSPFDAYALGTGGSHCGGAPAGLDNTHVFGFVKVSINGQQVTVTPTDSLGRTFDVQTYTFPASETDSTPPTPPANVRTTAVARGEVDLAWDASTDAVGVTGYLIYRDGGLVATLTGTGTTYADTTVTGSRTYAYTVTAIDAAGNQSAHSGPLSVTTPEPPDTQPPTRPRNLSATAPATSVVNLSWTRSTDDLRVIGYRVLRDGVALKAVPDDATVYQDESTAAATTYTYEIRAFDGAYNESPGATITITTPSTNGAGGGVLAFAPTDDATIDASNPNTPLGAGNRLTVDTSPVNDFLLKFAVAGTGSGSSCPTIASAMLRLTVGNTANDNSPKGGSFEAAAASPAWSEASVTWNTAPPPGGQPVTSITTPVALGAAYRVDVTPLVTGNGPLTIRVTGNSSDGARYYSRENSATLAPELDVTCGSATPDTKPPTAPGTPTLTGVTSSTVSFSWTPSTDNVGVIGYRIFRDGDQVGQTGGSVTTFQDTGLSPGTAYSYTLKAVDAVGNASPESGALHATTSVPSDTSPPTTPGTPTAVGGATTIRLTWAASADDVGVTSYSVFRDGNQVGATAGSVTNFQDTPPLVSATFSYTVRAFDASGKSSPLSAAAITPRRPATPTATATATTATLSWAPNPDTVTSYAIFRNGGASPVGTVPAGPSPGFTDGGLSPSTTYSYTVQAVNMTNSSLLSAPVSVTTGAAGGGTLAFAATDDATIDASNVTARKGTSNRIVVDSSPVNDVLVRFDVSGTGAGTSCPRIASAKLRLTVGNAVDDNSNKGGDFRAAVSSSWSEATVSWSTAPAAAAGPPVASIGTPVALGTAYLVDVTPIVTGNGPITIRASGNTSDGARYYSRNGNPASLAPELDITCG